MHYILFHSVPGFSNCPWIVQSYITWNVYTLQCGVKYNCMWSMCCICQRCGFLIAEWDGCARLVANERDVAVRLLSEVGVVAPLLCKAGVDVLFRSEVGVSVLALLSCSCTPWRGASSCWDEWLLLFAQFLVLKLNPDASTSCKDFWRTWSYLDCSCKWNQFKIECGEMGPCRRTAPGWKWSGCGTGIGV